MTFEQFDVVVIPFPFTDKDASKRRPALVLSTTGSIHPGRSLFAMITSSGQEKWPLDQDISDLAAAGLHSPCTVRLKLFTLDNELVIRKIGALPPSESVLLKKKLFVALGCGRQPT